MKSYNKEQAKVHSCVRNFQLVSEWVNELSKFTIWDMSLAILPVLH